MPDNYTRTIIWCICPHNHGLYHYAPVTPYGDRNTDQHNISSGNSLLPYGTKPFHQPRLTFCLWRTVAFTWEQFHNGCLKPLKLVLSMTIIHLGFPKGLCVNITLVESIEVEWNWMRKWNLNVPLIFQLSKAQCSRLANWTYILRDIWICVIKT